MKVQERTDVGFWLPVFEGILQEKGPQRATELANEFKDRTRCVLRTAMTRTKDLAKLIDSEHPPRIERRRSGRSVFFGLADDERWIMFKDTMERASALEEQRPATDWRDQLSGEVRRTWGPRKPRPDESLRCRYCRRVHPTGIVDFGPFRVAICRTKRDVWVLDIVPHAMTRRARMFDVYFMLHEDRLERLLAKAFFPESERARRSGLRDLLHVRDRRPA
jgi:hypothetical protein